MIPAEPRKRLLMLAFLSIIFIGGIGVVWFFLNRGTIIITAKAPYRMLIDQTKNIACQSDQCTLVLNPGAHHLALSKQGYADENRDINVPMNGKYEEAIHFRFLPVVTDLGNIELSGQKNLFLPTEPDDTTKQQLDIEKNTPFFYDAKAGIIWYIQRQKSNFRQALYVKNIKTQTNPILLTSFLRDLANPILAPAPDQQKILVVDRASSPMPMYEVDLVHKNRTNILTFPFIQDVKWLSDSQSFLMTGRNDASPLESLFTVGLADAKVNQLGIKAFLSDVTVLDPKTLLLATDQIPSAETDPEKAQKLEGTLVTLSDPSLGSNQPAFFSIIQYDTASQEARLIKIIAGKIPDILELSDDHKRLFFHREGRIYQVTLNE